MEIDRRCFQIEVTELHLNRLQIGPTLQQVCCPAVAQQVRRHLLLYPCTPCRFADRVVYRSCTNRLFPPRTPVAGKKIDLGFPPFPVGTQDRQQFRRQRDIAILLALALTNVNHHALAINVGHPQSAQFLPTQSSPVQRYENHTVVRSAGGFDESSDFLLTQNYRQSFGTFWIDQIDLAVSSPKHFHEEEPQCGDPPDNRFHGELAVVEQMQLILS